MISYYKYKNWVSWRLIQPHLCTLAVAVSYSSSWRVPRDGFRFGGLSSALAVTVAAALVALPVVLLQLAVGQLSQQDAVGVWRAVPFFKGIGYMRLLISLVGSVYTIIYLSTSAAYIFYSLNNSVPSCKELIQLSNGSLQFQTNASKCLNEMFLAPVNEQPEYYVALALIVIVIWILFPFILYNPVKMMKRMFYVFGTLVVLLSIIIVFSIGTSEGISFFNKSSDWVNFVRPYIWHSAITQSLLFTQTAGGYLISSGGSLYSNTDVQWNTFIFVGSNVASCWTGLLFWFAIGGTENADTSNVAVLVQIYKVTIEQKLGTAWLILVLLLLFTSGIITMLTLLYPLYDRFHRVGGYRWRYLSIVTSVVGAGVAAATLAVGQSSLTLMEDVALPLMISLVTLIEISAFVFIYGWKVLVEDIEFLIGRKLRQYWVLGWCSAIGILSPFTTWWTVSWFIDHPNWIEPPWEATGILVTAVLFVILFIIFAAISVANQVQYDFVGKLKSSFEPSRHWGPRDPITHHYWLARRRKGCDIASITHSRTLGELNGASSPPNTSSLRNKLLPENKMRSNSDDWLVLYRKQRFSESHQINCYKRIRSKSLDWNMKTKIKLQKRHFIKHTNFQRKHNPNEPTVIILEQNNNTISLESLNMSK